MSPWIQNTLVCSIVAAAALYLGVSLWRWMTARRQGCGGCHGCQADAKPNFVTLQMHPLRELHER
jgi:hypothetical protein